MFPHGMCPGSSLWSWPHPFLRGLWIFTFLVLTLLSPPMVWAHKGHAGPKVVFLKKKAALKQLLPEGAKLAKRKERLKTSRVAWAREHLGMDLDPGIYTYYLARDPQDGRLLGGAMILDLEYRHGQMALAVGVDAQGQITGAAILSINKAYVKDLKKTFGGGGFLQGLRGWSVQRLIEESRRMEERGSLMEEEVYHRLAEGAALLVTFLQTSQHLARGD